MHTPAAELFAIYLHWPFCAAKCPYCDFNSHVASRVDQAEWAMAFQREIARLAQETPDRLVSSIYFGGGTPSLMNVSTVEAILGSIAQHWRLRNEVEITLEANPSSVESGRFMGYRAAGVNRVSMGFQSLRDDALRELGRLHDAESALRALDVARSQFDRVSFDLIYARQNQSLESWQAELTDALSLQPDHLSLYQLTIEEGTPFAERLRRGGLSGLPNEDLSVDLFNLTQELCDQHGLPAYEVSNHARPGQESRHNLTYWRGGDYLGIGPGAHGRLTVRGRRHATESLMQPGQWLTAVQGGKGGESHRAALSPLEVAEEMTIMGLRMACGLDRDEFGKRTGYRFDDRVLADLVELDMITSDGNLCVTSSGRLVLNQIIHRLAASIIQI